MLIRFIQAYGDSLFGLVIGGDGGGFASLALIGREAAVTAGGRNLCPPFR